MNNFNKKTYKKIQKVFEESSIKDRIVFLGVHGSSMYKEITDSSESDYDIELILEKPEKFDYEVIKNVINSLNLKIECQLRYEKELYKPGLIHQTNYKTFMYYSYSNGITLLGRNIYKDLINNLLEDDIRDSFLLSAQIAFKDIRKAYLGNKSVYEINKQSLRFLMCLCFAKGEISSKQLGTQKIFSLFEDQKIIDLFIEKFESYLDERDIEIMINAKENIKNTLLDDDFYLLLNRINDKSLEL